MSTEAGNLAAWIGAGASIVAIVVALMVGRWNIKRPGLSYTITARRKGLITIQGVVEV